MDSKEAIRTRMLRRRADRPVDPALAGHAAVQALLELPELKCVRAVAAYSAFRGEIDLRPLMDAWLAGGRSLFLPRFNRCLKAYELAQVTDMERDTAPGVLGIVEPLAGQPTASPDLLRSRDIGWLVPGVAFDERGNRLGHGAGHYDRLLRLADGVRIGVAFDWQIVSRLPTKPHDVPMHLIVSERRVIRCARPQDAGKPQTNYMGKDSHGNPRSTGPACDAGSGRVGRLYGQDTDPPQGTEQG